MTYSKACRYFPGGVNSPVRACRSVGIIPPIVSHAFGDKFTDSTGREYLDFCGSWGSLIHGHSHPMLVEGIRDAVSRGTSYGLTSEYEITFASHLSSALHLDAHYQYRFVSSGTEAAMSAVRLACGVTNRRVIIKFLGCYHGHSDVLLAGTSVEEGALHLLPSLIDRYVSGGSSVPLTLLLPYNEKQIFQEVMHLVGEHIAGVIVEPIAANMGIVLPEEGFLESILALCQKFSSLSIVDEVVTGFRVGLRGACALFSLVPDIVIYGKIIGGGMAVAALVARQEIMHYLQPLGPVFQAGTLSGNPVAMVAGRISVGLCCSPGFYTRLDALSSSFLSSIREEIWSKGWPVSLVSLGSMFTLFFCEEAPKNFAEAQASRQDLFGQFYRYVFSRGVYLSPSPLEVSFISSVHTQESLSYTRDVLIAGLRSVF